MADRGASFTGGFWTTIGVIAALFLAGLLLSGRR